MFIIWLALALSCSLALLLSLYMRTVPQGTQCRSIATEYGRSVNIQLFPGKNVFQNTVKGDIFCVDGRSFPGHRLPGLFCPSDLGGSLADVLDYIDLLCDR